MYNKPTYNTCRLDIALALEGRNSILITHEHEGTSNYYEYLIFLQ